MCRRHATWLAMLAALTFYSVPASATMSLRGQWQGRLPQIYSVLDSPGPPTGGLTLTAALLDFEGDGRPEVISSYNDGFNPSTSTVRSLSGQTLYERVPDNGDFSPYPALCGSCQSWGMELLAVADVDAAPGREAIFRWGSDVTSPIDESFGIAVFNMASDALLQSLAGVTLEAVHDHDGDGFPEMVLQSWHAYETVGFNHSWAPEGIQIWGRAASASVVPDDAPRPSSSLSIAPNPARGRAIVKWSAAPHASVTIRIFDIAGREVRRYASVSGPDGAGVVEWDAHDEAGGSVSPGTYFAEVAVGEQRLDRRVVILR